MAQRTQVRLSQITGSFDTTNGINDQIALSATGSIVAGDIQSILSHMAGAIKRIHGADSFSENSAGNFSQDIVPASSDGAALGSTSNEWSDLYLADGAVINLGNDQDVTITHVADTGVLLNGTSQIQLRDSAIFLNSSADGTLDIEADSQINLGTDNSGVAITIGHTTSEVTIADNLTVTGDLTVNGDTTTISTTNLTVQDRMIVVHSDNTAIASDPNGSSAIAFMSGSNTADESTILGTVDVDVLGVARMDITGGTANPSFTNLVDFRAAKFQVASAADNIAIDGGNLVITAASMAQVTGSTGIKLGTDIGSNFSFEIGGNQIGSLEEGSQGEFVLSSSAGVDLTLSSNNGRIALGSSNDEVFGELLMDSGASSLTLSSSAGNDLILDSNSGKFILGVEFDSVDAVGVGAIVNSSGAGQETLTFVESNAFDNTHFVAQINKHGAYANQNLKISGSLVLIDDNAGNGVTLDVASSTAAYTLTLPSANGNSGQVLKLSDGNGNLTFGDATGDLARFVFKVTQTVSAGNVDFGSSKTAGISALTVGAANLAITKSDADLNKSLEVFVNGQLLVSGSSGNVDADYTYIDADTLNFAFNLETDDIVQIIQR